MTIRAVVLLLLTTLVSATEAFQSSLVGTRLLSQRASNSQLCMSTIAVIGASGLTAQECIYQALERDYNVVGLTRWVHQQQQQNLSFCVDVTAKGYFCFCPT